MTSLPKTMAKFGLPRNYTIPELSKYVLFIDFEPLCQKLSAFCQVLACFTMPTHQIWSSHVTQNANFPNFLFCPNSTLNIWNSHKTSSRKLSTSEIITQRAQGKNTSHCL